MSYIVSSKGVLTFSHIQMLLMQVMVMQYLIQMLLHLLIQLTLPLTVHEYCFNHNTPQDK